MKKDRESRSLTKAGDDGQERKWFTRLLSWQDCYTLLKILVKKVQAIHYSKREVRDTTSSF